MDANATTPFLALPFIYTPAFSFWYQQWLQQQNPDASLQNTCSSSGSESESSPSRKSYECQVCGKKLSRKFLLAGHSRTHSGEKPFSCCVCTKSFADKSNLRAHERTHSKEKQFVCDLCNKRFSLKSYLNKHRVTHENDQPVKN